MEETRVRETGATTDCGEGGMYPAEVKYRRVNEEGWWKKQELEG